jgi:hypothetical protein
MVLASLALAARTQGLSPPAISSPPQNQTLIRGSNASFAVTATGGSLSYQWFFNDVNPIPGATGTALTLANAQAGQEGGYTVLVTNVSGSVTSAPAYLTVLSILTNSINPYTPGSLGYDLFAGTYALANSTNRTASYIPNAASLGTNSAVWTWPVNLSCVGYASDGYQSVLIAPDKLLTCAHFGGEAGQTVTFHDTNGILWTAVVTNTLNPIADIVIARLKEPAPPSILIPYVLPADYTNYVEGHTLLGMPAFWLHKNSSHIDYDWVVYLDDYNWYGYGTWMGLDHASDWPSGTAATGGDSGSPAFLSWSNHPVLLYATTLTPDSAGLFVSGLTNWNSLAQLGSTNGMKILDISGYPPEPPILRDPNFGYDYVVPPQSQTAPSGSVVTLEVSLRVLGASLYSYQWQLDGTNLLGATASSLAVVVAPGSVGTYSVVISNDLGSLTLGPALVQLTSTGPTPATDGPLPPWTSTVMAILICALGARVLAQSFESKSA